MEGSLPATPSPCLIQGHSHFIFIKFHLGLTRTPKLCIQGKIQLGDNWLYLFIVIHCKTCLCLKKNKIKIKSVVWKTEKKKSQTKTGWSCIQNQLVITLAHQCVVTASLGRFPSNWGQLAFLLPDKMHPELLLTSNEPNTLICSRRLSSVPRCDKSKLLSETRVPSSQWSHFLTIFSAAVIIDYAQRERRWGCALGWIIRNLQTSLLKGKPNHICHSNDAPQSRFSHVLTHWCVAFMHRPTHGSFTYPHVNSFCFILYNAAANAPINVLKNWWFFSPIGIISLKGFIPRICKKKKVTFKPKRGVRNILKPVALSWYIWNSVWGEVGDVLS